MFQKPISGGNSVGNERPRCELETSVNGRGKVIFNTFEEAEAFESKNRLKYDFEKQYVYACPHTKHFHLTTNLPELKSSYARVNFAETAKFKAVTCVNSHDQNGDIKNTENPTRKSRRHFSLEQKAEN